MRRIGLVLGLALALTALAVPAGAVAADGDDVGYLRVAHLSPDTAAADVSLSALAGGTTFYELSGVPYGGVSKYMPLAPGTYALGMAPTEPGTNTPVVTAEVRVTPGTAITLAALGPNASIHLVTVEDDLTPPAAGKSRVRIVQASTTQDDVSVRTADGTELAANAEFESVGDYVELPPGRADLTLTTPDGDTPAAVELRDAAAQTVFLLDSASGELTALAVIDSAGVTETPVGGVATGGGALAVQAGSGTGTAAGLGLLAALVLALTTGLAVARRAERRSA